MHVSGDCHDFVVEGVNCFRKMAFQLTSTRYQSVQGRLKWPS